MLSLRRNKPAPQPEAIVRPWTMRLRWGSVASQLVMVLIIRLAVDPALAILPLFILISFQGVSNLVLGLLSRRRRAAAAVFNAAMFLDIILFTVVLALTGGPMNPFTFFYLVHLAIGAMLMSTIAATLLALTAIAGYALLFLVSLPALPVFEAACHAIPTTPAMVLHLKGMWLAFAVTSLAVIFLTSRIRRDQNDHRLTLEKLRDVREKNEKLAALATLAGGAAHELSTPLATIAVASAELEDELGDSENGATLREDAGLIRAEVKRCKDILAQMSSDAGEPQGELPRRVSAEELLETILARTRTTDRKKVQIENHLPPGELLLPPIAISRALRGLVKNGFDAGAKRIKISLPDQRGK